MDTYQEPGGVDYTASPVTGPTVQVQTPPDSSIFNNNDTFSLNNLNAAETYTNSKYKVGAWNVNGWNSYGHPENSIFKCNVINCLDLDAIFISETFCRRNDTFTITNYTVVQFNRQKISQNSVRGSGGCAIALSDKLLSNHVIVDTIKGRQDGILAVKLRCTDNDALVGLLANYLPPDSYHYGKDPESYYLDNSLVYTELEDCDLLIAGGDLNSRTQDDLDYLPCVDADVSSRSNPDNEKNKHGEYFLQFLKDNRALICNGRVTPDLNDFTFVRLYLLPCRPYTVLRVHAGTKSL